jgi:hypothetical protein
MELGIHGVNSFATHTPGRTARLARLAEDLGYRSWWAGDHVVLPGGDIDLGTWRYRSAGYAVTSSTGDLYGIRSRLRRESAARRGSAPGAARARTPGLAHRRGIGGPAQARRRCRAYE